MRGKVLCCCYLFEVKRIIESIIFYCLYLGNFPDLLYYTFQTFYNKIKRGEKGKNPIIYSVLRNISNGFNTKINSNNTRVLLFIFTEISRKNIWISCTVLMTNSINRIT
jgi:hypothetical protein